MTETAIATTNSGGRWRLFGRPRRLLGFLGLGLLGGATLLLPSGGDLLAPACLFGASLLGSAWAASRLAPALPLKAQIAALGATTAALTLGQAAGLFDDFWSLLKTGRILDLLTSSGLARFGATPDFLLMQAANPLSLIAFPFLVRLVAEFLARRRSRRQDPAPDPALADAAGWSSLVFSLGLTGVLVQAQGSGEDVWLTHLQGFPWALALAPGLYLGFALQRADSGAGVKAASEGDLPDPPVSVHQLYEKLRTEPSLRPHTALALWNPPPASESASARAHRREEDVAALLRGASVKRLGGLDAEFLRLVFEAAEAFRAQGETILLICPDGAGAPLLEHFRRAAPEAALSMELWSRAAPPSAARSPEAFLDLAILEEGRLGESLEAAAPAALERLLRRMGLLVVLELQDLEASRLLSALTELKTAELAGPIGLLTQSQERFALDGLISRLRAQIPTRNLERLDSALRPEAAAGGAILLCASESLREALAAFGGLPNPATPRPAEAYLALPAWRAPGAKADLRVHFFQSAEEPPILQGLQADLAPEGPNPEESFGAFSRPVFERSYAILADPENFIIESQAPAGRSGAAPTLRSLHAQMTIERVSTGFFALSPDLDPEASAFSAQGRRALDPPIRRRLPFRSLALLRFEDPERRHLGDAVLRRSLAASLQMVLGLAFPGQHRRLAVVPLGLPPEAARLALELFACLHAQGRILGAKAAELCGGPPEASLCFAVIEDGGSDLGVARRICADPDALIPRWRDFLLWASQRPEWSRQGFLDAKAAAAILS